MLEFQMVLFDEICNVHEVVYIIICSAKKIV